MTAPRLHRLRQVARDALRCLRLRAALRLHRLLYLGTRRRPRGDTVEVGIFRRGGIGDWALFVPTLAYYAALFPAPRHRITVYGDQRFAAFTFLSSIPYTLVAIDQARWRGSLRARRALLRAVRAHGFDVWIDTDVSRNKVGLLLADAACAPQRYTLGADAVDRCPGAALLAAHFDAIAPAPAVHEHEGARLQRLAHFVAAARHAAVAPLPLPLPLPRFEPPATQRYAVLFCGASVPAKAWPLPRYAEVARHLHARHGLIPVLLGDDASPGLDALLGGTPCIDLRRRTDAHALLGWLAHAQLTVSNDSAAVHLAALLDRPVLIVAPGAAHARYCRYPNGRVHVVHCADTHCFDCEGRCRYPAAAGGLFPCLDAVGAHAVNAAADALLGAPDAPGHA